MHPRTTRPEGAAVAATLLLCALTVAANARQASKTAKAPDMAAIRRQFAMKDVAITVLRARLAQDDAEVQRLREQLTEQLEARPAPAPPAAAGAGADYAAVLRAHIEAANRRAPAGPQMVLDEVTDITPTASKVYPLAIHFSAHYAQSPGVSTLYSWEYNAQTGRFAPHSKADGF